MCRNFAEPLDGELAAAVYRRILTRDICAFQFGAAVKICILAPQFGLNLPPLLVFIGYVTQRRG